MNRIITLILALFICPAVFAQYFSDNFESYTVNNYLGLQSSNWTTWSNSPGSSEDTKVVNTNSSSGSNSIYFNSPGGGGPNDVVLPFGGVHSSGRFKFSANFYVPSGKSAYFNFQGGASVASIWSMDLYMRSYGTMDIYSGSSLSISYPQGRWFKLTIDADLDGDSWEYFIDNVSVGKTSNSNPISFIDIYEAESNAEYWIDDVEYCVNSACNPEISIDAVTINPSTVCTHHAADVTVQLKNHSTFSATQLNLGIDVGPDRMTKLIKLNGLAGGKDTTITIPGLLVPKVSGPSVAVKAINLSGDVNPINDTAKTTIVVNKSPSNTTISKATPFTTTRPLSSGTLGDPDIVAAGDVLTYNIDAPTGYTNSNYGTAWNITGFTLKTSTGRVIAGSYYTYANPSGSASAKFSFKPDTLLTDSTVIASFTVKDAGTSCDSSLQRTIYVAPRPKAGFNFTNVCDKATAVFTNTSIVASGALTYAWDFGDLTTSNFGTPGKLYAGPGTYLVKLIVTTPFGYVDSFKQNLTVYPIPVANFDFTNKCEGAPIQFIDNSTLPTGTPSFLWDFGTAPTSTGTGATTSKLYSAPGIYRVLLTVTVNGCTSTTTKYVTQAPRATPNFTFTPTQCDNGDVDFTNATTAPSFGTVSYFWKLGDGTESSTNSVSHVYNSFKTYNVVLIANTDLGCTDSITKQVILRESPSASFTNTTAKCTNSDITFTNGSVVPSGSTNSYLWDFGDGNTDNSTSPVHQYISPGDYVIHLNSISTNGCSSSAEASVSISQGPTAGFLADNECQGENIQFNNNSFSSDNVSLTYMWKFGNGDSSALDNPSVKYATAGTFPVSLTATHTVNGCATVITQPVTVYALPIVDIVANSRATGDGAMNFTTNSTGTGYTYLWYFGDGGTARTKDATYFYTSDGSMRVKLVVTSGEGCITVAADTVEINRLGINNVNGTTNPVTVYPNPSTGKFVVDFNKTGADNIKNINVTDMMGRTIANNIAVNVTTGFADVDLTAYAAGIYYLNIVTPSGTNTVKLNVTK